MRQFIFTFFLLLLFFCECADRKGENPGSNSQIPVIAYEGVPTQRWTFPDYSLQQSYKDLADAGFTANIALDISFHRGNPSPEQYFKTLDVAQSNGIKLFVSSEAILNFSPEDRQRLISHPALAAYRIYDEPWVEKYDSIGEIVRRVQAIDTMHPCYVNQFGMWEAAYPGHLRQFIEKVPVPQLSYDVYPVVLKKDGSRGVQAGFYHSLELFSREAKRIGKPFWAFALCFTHFDYPVPTLADLRLQVYSNLAYGAQAITYYSYWSLPLEFDWTKEENYGPIGRDGKKTDIYYTVQAMNREIKALSRVFLNANMIWTAYSGNVPDGCKALKDVTLPAAIKSVEIADNHDALISYMEKDDGRFLIIVNQNLNKPSMQAALTGNAKIYRIFKDASELLDDGKMQTVEAGDALIYYWNL
ncbi:MAG: hypothetical protein LBS52_09410 [Dysgonamonadaceae bacterium]|jgi:hypothetical protein|nr:hypothetical protein [Dysgonamonadaceae bacterium]